MAVTVEELAIALRVSRDGTDLDLGTTGLLARLLGVGDAHVTLLIPNAPDAIQNEVIVRLAAYLHDQPIGRRDAYANAWINSGAGSLASRWLNQRLSEGATITTPGGSALDNDAVNALIASWAQADNEGQIPASKLLNAGGGLGTDTDLVAREAAAAAQFTADTNAITLGLLAVPESWAVPGDDLIPDDKIARQIYVQSGALNINDDLGHTPGDVVLEIILGLIKVYQRNASGPPFYTLVGSTTASSALAGIAAWALSGNDDELPAAKFPFPIPDWLADPVGRDIPFSLLESTLVGWVQAGNEDPIPLAKLPTGRVVPSSVGVDDGSRISALDGEWTVGAPSVDGDGEDQDPTVWRIEYVRSDDIAGQLPGKVYIRLRYLDSFNIDTGNRSRVIDTGSGYLTSAGGRTISLNAALDIRALLQSTSLSALMSLVTAIPTPGSATWGEWYGHTDADGRVLGVYYRREQETSEMDWWAERLSSTNRDLHGFAQVSRSTYTKGGALYPTNEGIEELIEEMDAGGNVTVRAVINDGGLLQSGISIIVFWANEDGEFSSAREMPLFHDASYTVAGQRRYVSTVGTEFTFTAGHRYRLHWRNAGQAHDLILNVAQHMVQVADHDHIADLRAEAFEEIYQVEDRVAVLEAVPAPEGGGGLTPEKIYTSSGTIAKGNRFHQESLDPDVWYQILLKNDRGLTPMISGKFLQDGANRDAVYVRGWLRGSTTSYLEFEVRRNGTNIEFEYYGPLSGVAFGTNLEVWKYS